MGLRKTLDELDLRPKNRDELLKFLKACTNPETQDEWDIAFKSPYSPFFKLMMNLQFTRDINRRIDELLELRAEFEAEDAKRKEEEELKDELSRAELADRRMAVPKEEIFKAMEEVVKDRDLAELKALQAQLAIHIQGLNTQINSLQTVIGQQVAQRNVAAAQVQATQATIAGEIVNYLRANPFIDPRTGLPMEPYTEDEENELRAYLSPSSINTLAINPGMQENVYEAIPSDDEATGRLENNQSVLNQLKTIIFNANKMNSSVINVHLVNRKFNFESQIVSKEVQHGQNQDFVSADRQVYESQKELKKLLEGKVKVEALTEATKRALSVVANAHSFRNGSNNS